MFYLVTEKLYKKDICIVDDWKINLFVIFWHWTCHYYSALCFLCHLNQSGKLDWFIFSERSLCQSPPVVHSGTWDCHSTQSSTEPLSTTVLSRDLLWSQICYTKYVMKYKYWSHTYVVLARKRWIFVSLWRIYLVNKLRVKWPDLSKWYWQVVDWFTLAGADFVLCDTSYHIKYLI